MWMERELGSYNLYIYFNYGGRGREYRIADMPVEGYYEIELANKMRYVL